MPAYYFKAVAYPGGYPSAAKSTSYAVGINDSGLIVGNVTEGRAREATEVMSTTTARLAWGFSTLRVMLRV